MNRAYCFWRHAPLILLTLALVLPAIGQEPPIEKKRDLSQVKEKLLDEVEFPGGTTGEYIKLLQTKVPLNCVISEPAVTFRLPEISLRLVTVADALEAMTYASSEVIYYNHSEGNAFLSIYLDDGFVAPSHVIVRNLRHVLDVTQTEETVMSAIEMGLEMQSDGQPKLTVKYHPASGLLFARGTQSQLDIVEQVISELEQAGAGERASLFRNNPGMGGGSGGGAGSHGTGNQSEANGEASDLLGPGNGLPPKGN